MTNRNSAPSLKARLEAFWRDHPHAVMTLERICIDFGVSRRHADKTLRRMRYAGELASAKVWLPARTDVPGAQELEVQP